MKTSYNYLKNYVDIDVTPEVLCDKMVMAGFEVEEIIDTSLTMQGVVTGRILEIKKHENSDHLLICKVDIGSEQLQIITGADNIFEGAVVPVAMDGSVLPDGTKIKKGKLRGEESCGMLCSGGELNLKEEDFKGAGVNGILIMPEDTAAGVDMCDILGLNDFIIDFKITANRPDCQSIIGIAREAAAVLNKPFRLPETDFKTSDENIKDLITVENRDYELCPRYMGRVVTNIRIKESPEWMKRVLRASGMRPINNIVDITNFVMLETGQPMHAFDLRELEDDKIIVRRAEKGESIVLLDGKDAALTPEMLVIADGRKPSCLAGVMGGEGSGIKDDTSAVFFECAKFRRDSIRRTAKAVGVRTESSARYEKGTDIYNVEYALNRAMSLICELDAGDVAQGAADLNRGLPEMRRLDVSVSKINELLGLSIDGGVMAEILNSLQIKTTLSGDTLRCDIPSFRDDIEFTADIAEEVMRLYGYDHIIGTPLRGDTLMGGYLPRIKKRRRLAKQLASLGLFEIYTYSFIAKGETETLGLSAENAVTILNPLGEEYSVMRTQLVSSMLKVLSTNQNRGIENASFYEISKRFMPKQLPLTEQPEERDTLCIGMYGDGEDFFTLKGVIEQALSFLGVSDAEYKADHVPPYLHPGRAAAAVKDGKTLALFGEVHPLTAEKYGLDKKCYVAEIYIDLLEDLEEQLVIYKPLPKFPAVQRDLALICDADTPVGSLNAAIKNGGGELLEELKLFDVYTGSQIESGKKSVAYSITLRSPERTLTDQEVDKTVEKILKELQSAGAQLRS